MSQTVNIFFLILRTGDTESLDRCGYKHRYHFCLLVIQFFFGGRPKFFFWKVPNFFVAVSKKIWRVYKKKLGEGGVNIFLFFLAVFFL